MQNIKRIISELDKSKSSGIEHLSSRVLIDAYKAIPNVLLHIMNLCIATAVFPDSWKLATILPLEKVKNATSPSDFRPISLLPLPGKIMERIVSNQTTEYLESNNLISDSQSGYRSARSTISSISDLTDDLHQAIERKELSIAVFIDFRKAFDCVDHNILLSKHVNVGFTQHTIAW